jgi:riboflavin kinase / FMN adenylyltransferase
VNNPILKENRTFGAKSQIVKIFTSIESFDTQLRPVLTVGIFDGVHQGHCRILDRVIRRSKQLHTESLVMTFDPHPREVLQLETGLKFLSTIEERARLLEKAGIDNLLIVPFTKQLATIEAEEFVRDVFVKKLQMRYIISGYDHRFGKNGSGNFLLLERLSDELGFETEEIPAYDIDMAAVNSTRIREALKKGNVLLAGKLLGYNYFLRGIVVKGQQVGSKLGFPTANLSLHDSRKLIPADGVYSVTVNSETEHYQGMMNIGQRPTFNGSEKSMEVHLFDCNQDLYGKSLEICFIDFIRQEQRFESAEALKQQLIADSQHARKQLSSNE